MNQPDEEREPVNELLKRAGLRALPPLAARQKTYVAVHAAWRKAHRQRIRLRHFAIAAAFVACVAIESLLWQPWNARHTIAPAARVESVSGEAVLTGDSGASTARVAVNAGQAVRNGDVVRSTRGSNLVLRRAGGLAIHVGPDSEIAFTSQDDLRLLHGVVYVDTQGAGRDERFTIVTHVGRIRHVGTRFGVAVADGRVRVMVREGQVSIGNSRGDRRLSAGQEGRIAADGVFTTLPMGADVGPWNWLVEETPRFAIEDRNLRDVLQELSVAAGVEIAFASEADERAATQMVLHGPALALPPRAALEAALLTTQFTLRPQPNAADGSPRLQVVAR